jgi:DNA-binding MarR family transcriptional regulator
MWNDSSGRPRRSRDGERLTPLELAAWRGLLRVQARMLRRLDATMQAEHDLSLAEYEILLRLSERPDRRMRMAALADAIIRPRSTLTRVVGQLEQRGLVRRDADAHDGRGASAALTASGLRTFRTAQRTNLTEVRAAFLDHLDDGALHALASAWEAVDPAALAPAPDETT